MSEQPQANVWRDRLDQTLLDSQARDLACALSWLLTSHLQQCQHQRRCPEDLLLDEAQRIVGHANRLDAFARMSLRDSLRGGGGE